MSNWIFVINDSSKVFQERINEKTWPIFRKTQNRNKLAVGDRIIFYQAGMVGKKFLGKASIVSKLQKMTELDFSIKLSDVEVWKKPIMIDAVLNELKFIKDKQFWGRYFQGGVRSIEDSDYNVIIAKVKS